jgi:tetratricopeptide (TPR) repeat protein
MRAVQSARDEALIERYAGDAAAAERLLRDSCDHLRALGDTFFLSTNIGELADALYELGRYEEAEEATLEGKSLSQPADLGAQITWRRVRAKLVARGGADEEALRLVHEAIELAESIDVPELTGDVYRDLAEVERLGGRPDAAADALEQALAAYERKGLVPMAERTRREIADLRATV